MNLSNPALPKEPVRVALSRPLRQLLPLVISGRTERVYVNQSLRLRVYERDGGICQICSEPTRFFSAGYDNPFSKERKAGCADHIIPVSKGGTNCIENLRWTCRSCNCARGNKL